MTNQKIKKIFIADDDAMIRQALKFYLTQRFDCEINLFETGEECLEHMNEQPDIVVLDYYMDSVKKNAANGMEILKSIKKSYPTVHVIMLSNQEQYGVALQTLQKGAVQYVIKDEEAYKNIGEMIARF
jgi:two-component system OmpR family response regulator